MKPARLFVALAIAATHGALVAMSSSLPDAFAEALAWTVYGPLWIVSTFSIPVFSRSQTGGWAGPSGMGWGLLIIVWVISWWAVVELLSRLHHSVNARFFEREG